MINYICSRARNIGSHFIWWYRQKIAFLKADRLKFDAVVLKPTAKPQPYFHAKFFCSYDTYVKVNLWSFFTCT